MCFATLKDDEGKIFSSQQLKLFKLVFNIIQPINDEEVIVSAVKFNSFAVDKNSRTMSGINTPIHIEPRIPAMPQTGLFSWFVTALSSVFLSLAGMFSGILALAIQGADWLVTQFFALLGVDLTLAMILSWITDIFTTLGTAMTVFISTITMIFTVVTGPVVTFLIAIGLFITNLLQFWAIAIAFFSGTSVYTGSFFEMLAEIPLETVTWAAVLFYIVSVLETCTTQGLVKGYELAAIPFKILMTIFDVVQKVATFTITLIDKVVTWLMKATHIGVQAVRG